MRERLVVVGGDAAGMSAASQARRRRGPDDLEILALERGSFTSYSACGIPYWISGLVEERDQLVARPPEVFRDRQDIDVRLHHEVVALDLEDRRVTVRDHDAGVERTEAYDQLLLATGGVPLRPPLPGIDAPGVLGVQTLDDGRRFLDALAERAPRRAVVLGAGYIGLEMAEAMRLRGLEVDLVERGDCPMATIDADLGARIADALRGMGMRLHLGTNATGIETGSDGWARAVATDGGELPCDLVVLGTGVRPAADLGRAAGLPVGDHGALEVDRRQRTPVAGVWAAGDCAQSFHRIAQRHVSVALGTVANRQGRVAGINLGGGYATFPGVLGSAATKVCGLEIARTGLGEGDAEQEGFAPAVGLITSTVRAGYYPEAGELAAKVIADRRDGRLLGAQVVGEAGAAKRIDVFAVALHAGLHAAELAEADLSYAPPFSPVWDPVLLAARKAATAAGFADL